MLWSSAVVRRLERMSLRLARIMGSTASGKPQFGKAFRVALPLSPRYVCVLGHDTANFFKGLDAVISWVDPSWSTWGAHRICRSEPGSRSSFPVKLKSRDSFPTPFSPSTYRGSLVSFTAASPSPTLALYTLYGFHFRFPFLLSYLSGLQKRFQSRQRGLLTGAVR